VLNTAARCLGGINKFDLGVTQLMHMNYTGSTFEIELSVGAMMSARPGAAVPDALLSMQSLPSHHGRVYVPSNVISSMYRAICSVLLGMGFFSG